MREEEDWTHSIKQARCAPMKTTAGNIYRHKCWYFLRKGKKSKYWSLSNVKWCLWYINLHYITVKAKVLETERKKPWFKPHCQSQLLTVEPSSLSSNFLMCKLRVILSVTRVPSLNSLYAPWDPGWPGERWRLFWFTEY